MFLIAAVATPAQATQHTKPRAATAAIVNVSSSCSGQNQEVVSAADTSGDIYQAWIGCGGIGFARSTNNGTSYNAPLTMSGSSGAWDPALAVAPNGTVYVAFMSTANDPVVEASFDHGATFTQTADIVPPGSGYFGDRPFIAVAPDGTVYVTWDYGPNSSNVQTTCSPVGSCSFADGQLNAVIEKSTDGGKTFSGFKAIGPNYPTMGGFAAPLLVDSHGRVDSLYEGHPTDSTSPYAIHNGYEYFTYSNDAGVTWPSSTVQVRPDAGTVAVANWWINGSIAIDAGGTLYATWDTQTSGADVGWLSYSTDNGATWSAPTRVSQDNTNAAHIMEVTGGPAGTAYVGWQTSAPSQGYATYLQTFTTASGLVGTPQQISTNYGNSSVWPGDTFGLTTLPNNQLAVSWGSADNGSSTAEIYATIVSEAAPSPDFSMSTSPASGSATQGGSATATISTAATGGDTESVALSASGLPSGVTASFSPTSVTAGGSSTLTIATGASTPTGTYPITVTGTGTAHTHTTTYTLTVTAPVTNDFSISVSPASGSVTQGSSTTASVSTAVASGTAQTVTFSATGVPTGATATFSPTSATAGSGSTLTIATAATTPTGNYTINVVGTYPGGSPTHSASYTLTVTAPSTGGITNGGFETGDFTGWTTSGAAETVVNSGAHSGTYAARLGATTATNGDSNAAQTFTVPSGSGTLSFWYNITCPDTVTYDWATATLKDNTSNTTTTVLAKTCVASSGWKQVSTAVSAGHSYTLTLTSHDDNYASDPTYTLYDDVAFGAAASNPIVNGGFETGSLSGWTASGASETVVNSGAHSGTYAAQLGSTSATNGDSSVAQTFTASGGTLSFWYNVTCPDTVTYDWATATLQDNTANTTTTVLAKTCVASSGWTQVTSALTSGHSYTLTLTSHDDNYASDPTRTLFDDVAVN
jgi:hypothetical protein